MRILLVSPAWAGHGHRKKIKVHEIEKMGRKIVDSNELFFEDFEIPMEDRIGEEGKGF